MGGVRHVWCYHHMLYGDTVHQSSVGHSRLCEELSDGH